MKEHIEYSEKDAIMLDEVEMAIDTLSEAYKKVDERFLDMAATYRNHRKQLIEEQTEEEWDKNDNFYSRLWTFHDQFRSISNSASRLKDDIQYIRQNKSVVFVHP